MLINSLSSKIKCNIQNVPVNIEVKQQKKLRKKERRGELFAELKKAYKNQVGFFADAKHSHTDKTKEIAKIFGTAAVLTPFKGLMLIVALGFQIGIPLGIVVDIFTKYYLVVPRNKETDNEFIQIINSKTGMDQFMRLRPTIHTEVRNILQKHFLERTERMRAYTGWVQSKVSNIMESII